MVQMILILGGSQFMGLDFLSRISSNPLYKVVYTNRGRPYWNNEAQKYGTTFYPCNRDDYDDFIKVLNYVNFKEGITMDNRWIVIDFSVYSPKHIYVYSSYYFRV
jgi:hypothetical protein